MIEKEIEIKFKLNKDISNKLKDIKTTPYEEIDEYFSTDDMLRKDTFLRLRQKKGEFILNFKIITSKQSTHYEADEIQMKLDNENYQKMKEMLARTFPFNFTVRKIRNKGFLNECQICIDNVDGLGDFLEIEGPKEKIIEICNKFCLNCNEQDKEGGYAHMMARKLGLEN